ncbi:Hypp6657 [Branchiostoma lanceolatum]|uniref:Hypp6657 protein n=1 Tax=Branchiostoma lanceolatum TaxID=7740 RepID=A0A8J9YVB2_BRALA|nr:Hypp6657 [Branchiostoma lanceolatum]
MQGVREKASGGDSSSLTQTELRQHPREELQRMLHEIHLDQVRIPTGHLLAAEVDIGMNWSQCRDLKRWLKKYNVGVESEARSMKVAADLLSGIEIKAENLPFSVKGVGKEHSTVTETELNDLVKRVHSDPEVDQAQAHALHGLLPYVVAVEEAR